MSNTDALFPGFEAHWVDTQAGKIFVRSKGEGAPVLLLHGFPQSHVMWHRIAARLADHYRVVAMDLRGYGWSSAPRSEDGADYSKRVMAGDAIAVMESLGHVRFHLVGHDRGARVGYRLALDHPGRVEKLALLDIVPTCEVWRAIEAGRQPAAHWAFLAQAAPTPETQIAKNPDAYFEGLMASWTQEQTLRAFDPRAMAAWREAWGDSARIHAMCEDYRAGAGEDRRADEADLAAGKTLDCPTLVLAGDFFLTRGGRGALETWRATFAPHAVGGTIDSGHFVAEENPDATMAALLPFLADG